MYFNSNDLNYLQVIFYDNFVMYNLFVLYKHWNEIVDDIYAIIIIITNQWVHHIR